jgi:integrase
MPREKRSIPTRAAVVVGPKIPEPEQLRLFPCECGGVDLAQLRKERAALAEQRRAKNTVDGYAYDWKVFAAWCESADRRALPASSDTLQLYLMAMASRGRLPATMARHVAAVASKHAAAGLRSPVDVDVREVLSGLRRRLGVAPRHAKAAVTIPELRAMLRAMPKDGKGARDRALLLCGFATGLRRSELVRVQLGDVKFERRGAVISLGKSKADQEGRGRFVGLHVGKRAETCPVKALRAWIAERGPRPGALFLATNNLGAFKAGAMAASSVCEMVQDAARAAGLEASRFGAHSLRAGLVTAAGGAGVGTLAIMARTGHKDAKVVQAYMRPEAALSIDPLAGLL